MTIHTSSGLNNLCNALIRMLGTWLALSCHYYYKNYSITIIIYIHTKMGLYPLYYDDLKISLKIYLGYSSR